MKYSIGYSRWYSSTRYIQGIQGNSIFCELFYRVLYRALYKVVYRVF